jgi:hypothetical protein
MSLPTDFIETLPRPVNMRDRMARVDLRTGIEEFAKMALGQEIGGVLTATADVGIVMLRQAAMAFFENRRTQSVH